jgi:hypothetical protein
MSLISSVFAGRNTGIPYKLLRIHAKEHSVLKFIQQTHCIKIYETFRIDLGLFREKNALLLP